MYQSMSEIKKQQRIINRKIKKLMELHEEQCLQCADGDSELMEDLKSQIYYLNRKLKKLLEIQERHNQYWPNDDDQKQHDSKSEEKKDHEDKKEHKEEETKLELESSSKTESSPKMESSSKSESNPNMESCLKAESSSKSESSSEMDSCSKIELSTKPELELKPVPDIALKPAIELKDEEYNGDGHPHDHSHNHSHDHPKPEPPQSNHHQLFGFAYTQKGSDKGGIVKFQIAGPLHEDVSLTSKGLKVNKSGVYQINYSVALHAMVQTNIPASFELQVNDSISIAASLTQSSISGPLSISVLFSLLRGDVVELVAQLPAGVVYTSANLQILQVG
ncbi:hypothetical protein JOD29_003689 [Lysinibacillus composti]|uniref:Uncharacterized protein n=1 Tax=Lysinibacillus composti TaxID=720633 RepID=A0A3N9U6U8_9BACI|nr:hypothetical protein [Lysinibacillus composti]MBM7610407.1 hypothetical protein [Lysinibacillus composti]RQW72317.1 hypothetical protein EBB45_18365 [Lysinibacillus composti]